MHYITPISVLLLQANISTWLLYSQQKLLTTRIILPMSY
nr:MAG TPA: hypothetical protein [Caudoviricetes sp.]